MSCKLDFFFFCCRYWFRAIRGNSGRRAEFRGSNPWKRWPLSCWLLRCKPWRCERRWCRRPSMTDWRQLAALSIPRGFPGRIQWIGGWKRPRSASRWASSSRRLKPPSASVRCGFVRRDVHCPLDSTCCWTLFRKQRKLLSQFLAIILLSIQIIIGSILLWHVLSD